MKQKFIPKPHRRLTNLSATKIQAATTDSERAKIFAACLQAHFSHTLFYRSRQLPPSYFHKCCSFLLSPIESLEPAAPDEVSAIVGSVRNLKSSDSDYAGNQTLKLHPKNLVPYVCSIINVMMRLHYFLRSWKHGSVISTQTAGNSSKSAPKYDSQEAGELFLAAIFHKLWHKRLICSWLSNRTSLNANSRSENGKIYAVCTGAGRSLLPFLKTLHFLHYTSILFQRIFLLVLRY